uniref:Reverse transcriptase domain-containing protein n=1 Tax=Monopterus albus TaxID=43700 RepID=A0A3Q3IZ17_MONAL
MEEFLDKCMFPHLKEEEIAQLNSEITVNEIKEAIASIKNNRAPGQNGIPCEFYKKFSEILCPYLCSMFTQAQTDLILPPTLTDAIITVVHKEGKKAEEVGSYRPISLLNLDGKIYSKIIANRL